MLARYSDEISGGCPLTITEYADGAPLKNRGAVPAGSVFRVEVSVSRRLGDGGIVMRLCQDGKAERDIPLSFMSSSDGSNTYAVELKLGKGLYFWELLILRGYETLFVSTHNNKDVAVSRYSGGRFRLLAYEEPKGGNEWFCGGTMYQIFPDRFFKGSVDVPVREDALINKDWYEGVPQYAVVPGGHVKNNLFFGGTLWGISEKLGYLASLGVTILYLNPIFEAYSNHKYDTADYERVDEMFGGDAALDFLIKEAERRGMKLILDGVFNHTGSDSKYFNKEGKYGEGGAYNSASSEYRSWYRFGATRDDYESWWGIKILPRLDHTDKACLDYFTGEGGIGDRYIKKGIGGWRLDVADELSNSFLDNFQRRVRASSGGRAVIIGEVWENAVDKMAYGSRRRYFTDGQLDSVMNYPFKNAVIDFCRSGDPTVLYDTLTEIYNSYPPHVCHKLMNILGTHDTERILTRLGIDTGETEDPSQMINRDRAKFRLPEACRERAKKLLKMASVIQYTTYGVPSLYYGDEAGVEGYTDPFCRLPYPWGREDESLKEHYKTLGRIRQSERVFANGDFDAFIPDEGVIGFCRENETDKLVVLASRAHDALEIALDGEYRDLVCGKTYKNKIALEPDTAVILKKL